MKVFKCKGMTDLLPSDMVKFRHIEEVFRSLCLKRGYGEIRTPTLEYLHLFTASGTLTPAMLGRVYSFLDWDGWSGERVVLRPDGTIPVARLYLENLDSATITKLFYVENSFTFEETGTERRERWQCGVELIGSSQPLADVELLLLATEVLTKLGIGPLMVSLSHAGLIKALLAELGLGAAEQTEIFDRVLEGDIRALGEIKTRKAELSRALALLLGVKGDSPGFLENVRALLGKSRPKFSTSLDDLTRITELLSAMGCSYEIDITSGRGFEYYTGLMFQFYAGGQRVGGGGRYDDLIPLVGGPAVPASGFALYVDRLMELLNMEPTSGRGVLVKPASTDVSALKAGLEIAGRLRDAGHVAELDLGKASLPGYRWLLSVAKDGALSLVDQSTGKKSKAVSEADIAKVMEESR
jgi:histidyl-tRNA synthetase